ncbi:hypothetical protein SO694_0013801 [Aureococcus anophagefferens]|uniref:Uncharacterized protein n=1 Tax=Aureococcus anophagefferens TaxID=44056 RepID=A0ABR1GFV8_AURAN
MLLLRGVAGAAAGVRAPGRQGVLPHAARGRRPLREPRGPSKDDEKSSPRSSRSTSSSRLREGRREARYGNGTTS